MKFQKKMKIYTLQISIILVGIFYSEEKVPDYYSGLCFSRPLHLAKFYKTPAVYYRSPRPPFIPERTTQILEM